MAWGGMVASAVGGELQGWAAVLERKAMFDEFKKEQQRQQGYRDRGQNLFQGFLAQSTPDAARDYMAEGRAKRVGDYGRVQNEPLSVVKPTTGKTPQDQRDMGWADMMGGYRATIGSYGDWAFKQQINNIQNQEAIRQLVSFAGGDAQVFPYKMYSAQHSLDDLAMVGAAISSLGGGAANYGQFASQPTTGQGMGPGNAIGYNNQPLNPYLQSGGQLPADTIVGPQFSYT